MEKVFWTFKVKWDNWSHFEMLCKACVNCCPTIAVVYADTWITASSA